MRAFSLFGPTFHTFAFARSFGALSVLVVLVIAAGMLFSGYPSNGAGRDVFGGDGDDSTPTAFTFESAVQTGGTSGTTDSTALTLTFSDDPTTLTAGDITVTGATSGELTGTGTTRTLAISDITVGNGETVSVAIASPSGYTIDGSPETVVVYRAPYSGMAYQGGIIAYLHTDTSGLIAATEDISEGIVWSSTSATVEADTALGTGSANTDHIIAQAEAAGNSVPTTYAAGLARAYNGGGCSDWYLPSKDELDWLYENLYLGDHTTYIDDPNLGGFTTGIFWSSSQSSDDYWSAHLRWFLSGQQASSPKINSRHVRPVRWFGALPNP